MLLSLPVALLLLISTAQSMLLECVSGYLMMLDLDKYAETECWKIFKKIYTEKHNTGTAQDSTQGNKEGNDTKSSAKHNEDCVDFETKPHKALRIRENDVLRVRDMDVQQLRLSYK